jgi:protein-S-isoprenylcysteine O-methyltransferase Ste14
MEKTKVRVVGAVIIAALALIATGIGEIPRIALAILIGLPSFILIIVGRRQLGTSFAVTPKAKALVTTGLYSRIEHPLYFFLDLLLIAVIIALGRPIFLWVWGILVLVHILEARREEKVLAAAFRAEYASYREGTWF